MDKTIESISGLMEELQNGELAKVNRPHSNLWFRGQADFKWRLLPKVYRPDFVKKGENRLLKERQLNQEFRVRSAGIRAGSESYEQLYFLQQHYGMPTRLLDWTTSPLAGLFFAVSQNLEQDGKLFAMNASIMGPTQDAIQSNGQKFVGIATSQHPTFKDALKQITDWPSKVSFPRFIFPVRPDHFDRRISLQQSCFTFHAPRGPSTAFPPEEQTDQAEEQLAELTLRANSTLKQFVVPGRAKDKLRRELASLNINTFTIFGDLENLAKWLVEAHD